MADIHYTDIAVALIAASTTWGVYLHGRQKTLKAREDAVQEKDLRLRMQEEMAARRAALSYSQLAEHWEVMRQRIKETMGRSNIDRFMLFRAFNGKYDPQSTTAVIQLRADDSMMDCYIDYPIDDNYRDNLEFIRKNKKRRLRLSDFPLESEMHRVYAREGVEDSIWLYLCDYELPNGCWAIEYISVATHEAGGLTEDDLVLAEMFVGSMRKFAVTLAQDLIIYERSQGYET